MAFAIGVSFNFGRFHATPWGHHVNEGLPEWPPSPWRLLRALVATWKRKLYAEPLVNALMPGIIRKLLSPPSFHLPPASVGHTRHYMPVRGKGSLVFDAFVAIDPNCELAIPWRNEDLDERERAVMGLVLSNLNYLGRREATCSARVLDNSVPIDINCDCSPTDPGNARATSEPVRVLCADPKTALKNDYTPRIAPKKARRREDRGKTIPLYDPDWHLCLQTKDLHEQRWSDPPGSHWVTYYRVRDALTPEPVLPKAGIRTGTFTAARFILDAPVLPVLQETLYLGEIVRQFVQGTYGRASGNGSSPLFSGKDTDGNPLKGHSHAFFLPTDEDGDGKLDHLTIYCAAGFGPHEVQALDRLQRIRRPGGGVELNVMLTGLIESEDYSSRDDVALLSTSARWISITPFVPTRHLKKRGKKRDICSALEFPAMALREETRRRGLPEPLEVEQIQECSLWKHQERRQANGSIRWIQFRRERTRGAGKRGLHPGTGFVLKFPEPVRGPLAFGYGCHFGLGLFAPLE